MFPGIGTPRWVSFRNDASETAPAFAVLQPSGATTVHGQTVLTMVKPNSTPADICFINGPQDVPTGKYGSCTCDLPCYALYNDALSPAVNQIHGPKSGEWKLFNQRSGYTILSSGSNGRILVGPAPLASYGGLSGGGQVMTVGAGYTKLTVLTTSHVAALGLTVSEANHDITVDRDGAYFCAFTASVRYDTYAGAGPVMALHKNSVGVLGAAVACQIELNDVNYRSCAFAGIQSLTAGDVLDVRMNGPQEDVRFQLCQFTVHLVGVG